MPEEKPESGFQHDAAHAAAHAHEFILDENVHASQSLELDWGAVDPVVQEPPIPPIPASTDPEPLLREPPVRRLEMGKEPDPVPQGSLSFAHSIRILKQAWKKQRGYKRVFWGSALRAGVVLFLIGWIVRFVYYFWIHSLPLPLKILSFLGLFAVEGAITAGLVLGLFMIAIDAHEGYEIQSSDVFKYAWYGPSIFLTFVVLALSTVVGLVLFLLPGVYVGTTFAFCFPLMAERRMNPLDAMRQSWVKTHASFTSTFLPLWMAGAVASSSVGLFFLMDGILDTSLTVSLLSLTPAIWALPFATMVYASLYASLFESPAAHGTA